MKKYKFRDIKLLPFPIICSAATGNIDAINAVLRHYERYITALSTKRFYDENGDSHLIVDDEIRRRLETKLIIKILAFKVA